MSKDRAFEKYLSIGVGKENAVKRNPLDTDDRTFRELLAMEKKDGKAIISSPNGYYIVNPESREEVDEFGKYLKREFHRNVVQRLTNRAMYKTYLKMMREKKWEQQDG